MKGSVRYNSARPIPLLQMAESGPMTRIKNRSQIEQYFKMHLKIREKIKTHWIKLKGVEYLKNWVKCGYKKHLFFQNILPTKNPTNIIIVFLPFSVNDMEILIILIFKSTSAKGLPQFTIKNSTREIMNAKNDLNSSLVIIYREGSKDFFFIAGRGPLISILLSFVRSKPLPDWKSGENSQKARGFWNILSRLNIFCRKLSKLS